MLAVVIPYYKITFFEETLKSLANQIDKRFKVYIGDDASPENPKGILEKFEDQFDFVYYRFEKNLGSISLSQQWERCVALSDVEEWVMVLCDDDVLSRNCVNSFYENIENIEKQNINVVRFATDVIDEYGLPFNKVCTHPKLEKSTDFLIRRIIGGTRNSLSENIFRKEMLKKTGFRHFPLAWHSDDMAMLEFSNFGLLYAINEAIVFFRLSRINITNRNDNILLKNKASFQFYHYLIKNNFNQFNSLHIALLKAKLEKQILNDKKNIKCWISIIKLYCNRLEFKSLIRLFFLAFKLKIKLK